MRRTIFPAAALAMLAVPALADEVNIALVKEASQVAGCERIAEVRGKSAWGGVFAVKSYDWALSQMKQRAASQGATHVLILDASSGYMGSNMLGVAYKCPPPTPTSSAR